MKDLTPRDLHSIISSKQTTLVMFYAKWCGFCRRFAPIFSSAQKNSSIPLAKIDIDQDADGLWEAFDIEAVPTLIAFKDGKQIARKDSPLGYGLTERDLEEILSAISQTD
jgi:thioredoxin-like negative regulator of GroEL